jgi:hypothetical protein
VRSARSTGHRPSVYVDRQAMDTNPRTNYLFSPWEVAGRQIVADQSGCLGDVSSATQPPLARLSAKSWISRLAYLVSRS